MAQVTITINSRDYAIACGDGKSIVITELQADGGKRMAAADYLRGHPMQV